MGDINLNFQQPIAQRMLPTPQLNPPKLPLMPKGTKLRQQQLGKQASGTQFPTAKVAGIALDTILDKTNLFGGQFGNIFSSGLSSAGDTVFNNIIKGTTLTEGLGQNVGSSVVGTLSGLGANLVSQGINKIGGDSMLSRGIGQGTATGLGTIGGTALSNLISTGKIAGNASKLFGTGNNILTTTKTVKDAAGNIKNVSQVGAINPYALGASIVGTGLSAAFGPSKEYGGDYGNVTKTMDAAYDAIQGAVGFIPGYGQAVAGLMALNKGLSNVFGSTSGNTLQDAILGSAFMPAPVKWLNVAGKSTSRSVHNQSWQNTEKRRSFMGNAFGNIEDRIQTGIDHSNSTQGLFAKHYTNKFNRQVDFANRANDMLLAMADQNELQNIRSQYMSSINNQRYAQMIQGGYNPLAIGKQGMKILNNATNHNMGQRLLSAAALIDNKAMILSAQGGTKIIRQRPTSLRRKPATREEDPELWDEWERKEAEQQAARQRVYDQEQQAAAQRAETNTKHAQHYSNLATGVAETAKQNAQFKPVTQESLQNSNTEQLRQEQLADKNEYFDKGMDFINAVGFADLGVNVAGPLLQKGFRWAFDKAGQLIKVPKQSELFSRNLGSEKLINPDNSINIQEAVPEIVKGKNFVIEYLNSPVRTEVNAHNKKLADRLGFKLFKPFNEAGQRVSTPSNLKIVRENSSVGGSVSTDSKNPAADQVTINLYNSNPYYASMHENLHRGYLGNAPKEYFLNETRGTFGDTNRFYDYLKDKLLKPWSERYNLPGADYLDQSAELAVNMFEVGQRMGLKIGQKFPGNQKVLELLKKYKDSGDYKSGVVDHLNLKHPLRIWKALTGTLFSLPLVYGTVNNTIGQKIE